jgi:hypothetical protein
VSRRSLVQILCALAIFATQLVAIVHSTQHELTTAADGVHCELCAIAHAAPLPPSATLVPVLPQYDSAHAVLPVSGPADRRPFARPRSRAPPSSLA